MSKEYSLQQIDLESIILTNFEGKKVEISNLLLGFEIQESLFNRTMSASFHISNSIGIIEKFPIIGEEFVEVKFRTPKEKKYISYTFFVDSIEDRIAYNSKSEAFKLICVSTEELADRCESVNNHFRGMLISDMVKGVYNILKTSSSGINIKNKALEIEATAGISNLIGTGHAPFEFIKLCLEHSKSSKYPESDFIFFENNKGFNYKTISDMSNKDIKDSFYYGYNPNFSLTEKEIKRYQTITSISFNNIIDIINNLDLGLYDNTVGFFDPLTKKYSESRFHYKEDTIKFNNLGNQKIVSDLGAFSKKRRASPYFKYIYSNDISNYRKSEYIKNVKDDNVLYPFNRHEFLNRRISKIAQLVNGISLNIVIPGNSTLLAGDTINIFVPEVSSNVEELSNFNYLFGRENPKFLIAGLKHVFIGNEYNTVLKCVKSGYGAKIRTRE
jgi:hypothetical protein